MRSSPRRIVYSLGIATLLVSLVLHLTKKTENSAEEPVQKNHDPIQISPPIPAQALLPKVKKSTLDDAMLLQYASETSTAAQDLVLLRNYLDNVFILVKQRDPRHYATNADLVQFLLGSQGQQEPYLSADSSHLNQQKQLIDRYGSPIIIHPLSRDQIEIRSAGPDRIPYTEDDLVK